MPVKKTTKGTTNVISSAPTTKTSIKKRLPKATKWLLTFKKLGGHIVVLGIYDSFAEAKKASDMFKIKSIRPGQGFEYTELILNETYNEAILSNYIKSEKKKG